ncbi:MAG: hypothetical protein ACRERC_11525 [Candidatus Binatia bacterium]
MANTPVQSSSSLQPIVLAVLVAALAAAGAYIFYLRGREAPEAVPPVPVAGAPAAPAADLAPMPQGAAELLTAQQRDAMLGVLKNEADPARKAWFLVHRNDAQGLATQAALGSIFEEAGWPVEVVRAPYPLKAGVFLLAGDEDPPVFVGTANDALTAAGLEVQFLTGYREFTNERKTSNPKWVGPELAEGQAYTIVIGARPPSPPPGS